VRNEFFENGGFFFLFAIAAGVLLALSIVIALVVSWILYGAFERIPRRFRRMDPGLVWLLSIPCFFFVWSFVVFPKLSRSFKGYFDSVDDPTVGDCGEQLGLFCAIATVCWWVPCVHNLAIPASIVLLIVFLIKVHELKHRIPPGAA
jgi:hypothetical protein